MAQPISHDSERCRREDPILNPEIKSPVRGASNAAEDDRKQPQDRVKPPDGGEA